MQLPPHALGVLSIWHEDKDVKDVTLLRRWVINMLAARSTFSIITRNSVVTHY